MDKVKHIKNLQIVLAEIVLRQRDGQPITLQMIEEAKELLADLDYKEGK